jgi:hypothetical protein
MNKTSTSSKRLDTYSLEMIIVLAVLSLHDFLLSDVLSLPVIIGSSPIAQLRSLDVVVSSLEFIVPILILGAMLVLWIIRRNNWVHRLAIVYLIWITLRFITKVGLVLSIILFRTQKVVGVLLKDTIVLWFVNFLLFGVWYWIVDGGGPQARHAGKMKRYDFAFPQHLTSHAGWEDWQPGLWDYIFIGFSANSQFGLGDTSVLSWRAKVLVTLQVTLSLAVIVFLASIALGLVK